MSSVENTIKSFKDSFATWLVGIEGNVPTPKLKEAYATFSGRSYTDVQAAVNALDILKGVCSGKFAQLQIAFKGSELATLFEATLKALVESQPEPVVNLAQKKIERWEAARVKVTKELEELEGSKDEDPELIDLLGEYTRRAAREIAIRIDQFKAEATKVEQPVVEEKSGVVEKKDAESTEEEVVEQTEEQPVAAENKDEATLIVDSTEEEAVEALKGQPVVEQTEEQPVVTEKKDEAKLIVVSTEEETVEDKKQEPVPAIALQELLGSLAGQLQGLQQVFTNPEQNPEAVAIMKQMVSIFTQKPE